MRLSLDDSTEVGTRTKRLVEADAADSSGNNKYDEDVWGSKSLPEDMVIMPSMVA